MLYLNVYVGDWGGERLGTPKTLLRSSYNDTHYLTTKYDLTSFNLGVECLHVQSCWGLLTLFKRNTLICCDMMSNFSLLVEIGQYRSRSTNIGLPIWTDLSRSRPISARSRPISVRSQPDLQRSGRSCPIYFIGGTYLGRCHPDPRSQSTLCGFVPNEIPLELLTRQTRWWQTFYSWVVESSFRIDEYTVGYVSSSLVGINDVHHSSLLLFLLRNHLFDIYWLYLTMR